MKTAIIFPEIKRDIFLSFYNKEDIKNSNNNIILFEYENLFKDKIDVFFSKMLLKTKKSKKKISKDILTYKDILGNNNLGDLENRINAISNDTYSLLEQNEILNENLFKNENLNLLKVYRGPFFFALNKILILEESIERMILENEVREVIIYNCEPTIGLLIEDICLRLKIKYKKTQPNGFLGLLYSFLIRNFHKHENKLNFLRAAAHLKDKLKYLIKKTNLLKIKEEYKQEKILIILIFSINHFNRIFPILKELKKKNQIIYSINLSGGLNPSIISKLKDIGIESIDVKKIQKIYVKDKNVIRQFNNIERNLSIYKREIIDAFKSSERSRKREINSLIIYGLINNIFRNYNKLKFQKAIELIISTISPQIGIILNDLNPEGRIFNYICQSQNIKTIYIPHAFPGGTAYGPLETDFAFLSGDIDEKYYLSRDKNNTSITQIIKTGSSYFDKIYEKINQNKMKKKEILDKIKNELKIKDNMKIILVLTSPLGRTHNSLFLNSILNSINLIKNIKVIIKLHPRERINKHHLDIIKKYPENQPILLSHGDYDLFDLLNISDIVIARNSGALIEAVFFDKNIINLDLCIFYGNFGDIYSMTKNNAEIRVTKTSELKDTIEKLLYDKETQERLQKGREIYRKLYYSDFSGKNTFDIVTNIERIMKNN